MFLCRECWKQNIKYYKRQALAAERGKKCCVKVISSLEV
jgi:hypothetical protein